MFTVTNVFAATVSKTKTATVTTSNSCKVSVIDAATKNTTTGSWSFSVRCNPVSVPSGFTAQAYSSKVNNPILTNNGNTAKHSVVVSIFRSSSGQSAGSAMKTFTFSYNPSTGKIS